MVRVSLFALLLAASPAWGGDGKPTVIVPDAGGGTTVAKINGETVVLKKTPNGTVGKIGKDTVILHSDGKGNTIGKIGKDKLFCHTDPKSGITICK
ncbi:MAG: hypothetical protein AB1918_12260 [Pseudomonadota bacterium]